MNKKNLLNHPAILATISRSNFLGNIARAVAKISLQAIFIDASHADITFALNEMKRIECFSFIVAKMEDTELSKHNG